MEGTNGLTAKIEQSGTNQDPPSITQHSSNHFLVILLSVLLFISCLIAGFFVYQTQELAKVLQTMNSNSKPIPTAVSTSNPIAGWKTYINEKYKFSFKYPSEFSYLVEDEKFSDGDFQGVMILQNFPRTNMPNYSDSATFQMSVFVKKDNGEAIENGFKWINYGVSGFSKIRGSGHIYLIYFNLNKTGDTDLFNKILSTFKFIEPTTNSNPTQVACTMDAKICPDGSAVGRSGPKCEFAPCPTPKN